MRWNSQRLSSAVLGAVAGVAVVAGAALATPVTNSFTLTDVDWTSTAVGGVGGGCGPGGAATLSLAGVSGPVTHAYLYWHGIDNCSSNCGAAASAVTLWGSKDAAEKNAGSGVGGCDLVYDNPLVVFNGTPVVGVALGDATTNCWGAGSSRAFRADVTSLVAGNGIYSVANLAALPGHDCNGVSLIVTFDDGNPNNNRDLVFFEGNDSNIPESFPGEDNGWHASLSGITYGSGSVGAQLHLADGQNFVVTGLDDGALTFAAGGPPLVVSDALGRYDGDSVPAAGFSRSLPQGTPGELWDVHTFDLTPLFGAPGPYTLSMDGMEFTNDCLGLVLLIVDLEAGSAPIAVEAKSWTQVKRIYER